MSTAVQVALRVRPLIPSERVQQSRPCIVTGGKEVIIGGDRSFVFDHVFGDGSTQKQVYDTSVKELVDQFMQGYNATIIAYGQTSSGKTFTMGTESTMSALNHDLGIVPRVIADIYNRIDANMQRTCSVRVSFLEIHNEDVRDLLHTEQDADAKPITIRETADGAIVPHGVIENTVSCAEELLQCLEDGTLYRSTGSTMMNAHSSRSHAIFTVFLERRNLIDPDADPDDESNIEILSSKFHFVDLAGSERIKKTGATGDRMKEGININAGLFALGNVISALGDPKRKGSHVPFRDSKITRLLQDSLGGNSQTLMIACVSPADVNYDESLNTLRYANRAKNIQNKPVINRDNDKVKIMEMKSYIAQLEAALKGQGDAGLPLGSDSALRQRNRDLEEEVARLSQAIKVTRQSASEEAEQRQALERECDELKIQLKSIAERQGIDITTLNVDQDELNLVAEQRKRILELERENKELYANGASSHAFVPRLSTSLQDCSSSDEECDSADEVALEEEIENLKSQQTDRERSYHLTQHNLDREVKSLDEDLRNKEDLIQELVKTKRQTESLKLQYEKKIQEMENEALQVQQQRDAVLKQIEASQEGQHASLHSDRQKYEKRLKSLQSELSQYRTKLKESTRIMQLKAKDDAMIRSLSNEVGSIRNQKVKLQRKIKEESEKHREWCKGLENQIKTLVKKSRVNQIEMQKMKTKFDQREAVLKRRNEENASLHRQLKESQKRNVGAGMGKNNAQVSAMKQLIRKEIAAAMQQVALNEEIDSIEKRRDALETTLTKKRWELERLRRSPSTNEDMIRDVEDEIETLYSQIKYLNSQVKELRMQIAQNGSVCIDSAPGKRVRLNKNVVENIKLNRVEDSKAIILSLMNQILNKQRDVILQKQSLQQFDAECRSLRQSLSQKDMYQSVANSAKKRTAERRQSEIINHYEKLVQDIVSTKSDDSHPTMPSVSETEVMLEPTNLYASNSFDDAEDMPRFLDPKNYPESWKAKLAKRATMDQKKSFLNKPKLSPMVYKRLANPDNYTGTSKFRAQKELDDVHDDAPRSNHSNEDMDLPIQTSPGSQNSPMETRWADLKQNLNAAPGTIDMDPF